MGVEPTTLYASGTDGSQIAYQVVGEGLFDLIFLTGSLSHVDVRWENPAIARFLERLASFSRLILFDRRGVGASDRLPSGSIPSWEEWTEDLGAVFNEVGSNQAALLGVADGAPMAITYAATHPDRTKALVLFNAGATMGFHETNKETADFVVDFRAKTWGTKEYARAVAPSMNGDRVQLGWLAKYMRATASPRSSAEQLRAEFDMDVRSMLPVVQAPTLVLHRRDLLLPPVVAGRNLAECIPGSRFIEVPGQDTPPQTQHAGMILDMIEEFLTGVRPVVLDNRYFSTVMFTDIVDSTRLTSQYGDRAWHDHLDAHDAMVRRELAAFRGQEIKTTGDGFLATFDGPGRAIQCSGAIRRSAQSLGIKVRIGLHAGEIEGRGSDIGGMAVNIGARVTALAGPDEILASRTVTDLVVGSKFGFVLKGEYELKGVPGRWQLFTVGSGHHPDR